jgi:predicted nucleotidyltransferase component of viral defense system
MKSLQGGTCLRIVHGYSRFSEDIDFDNFNLDESTFEKVADIINKEMLKEGYQVEIKTVYKGAFHCYVRFPGLLYKEGLSGFTEEKILIQLYTELQHFSFQPERFLLNRFDVFTEIVTAPKDILLAQKFYTILNRTRNKGRDFFDTIFLLATIDKPNYDFLSMKAGINNTKELKEQILARCKELGMRAMADDVRPFLFNPADAKKVWLFPGYLKQVVLK